MSGPGRTIYIAGAGIAGMTLALALARFGANVVVLERNLSIQEFGAGLQISPNARRVLDRLGLGRAVRTAGFEPQGIDVYSYRSRTPLTTLTLGDAVRERFGAPYVVMHRADLAQALHAACKRFANIDIVFGVSAFGAENDRQGVRVTADDESVRRRSGQAFAFVGADGVHSYTRTALVGGSAPAFSGYLAWRALLPLDALAGTVALDRTSLFLAPGYHAVCYPLPHRGKLNLVLFLPAGSERIASATAAGPIDPVLPGRRHANAHFERLLEAARGRWTQWPLNRVSQTRWHRGNIGLIGDAAHAMMPFQAQGAAMSIEDAAILAPLLMTEPSAEAAFARYAALRQERVARVARESEANGFRFHVGWPASIVRDMVVTMQGPTAHFRRLDWLYSYDPAPEGPVGRRRRAPRVSSPQ